MIKSITNICNAADKGGYNIRSLSCTNDTARVTLEKEYYLFECIFDLNQNNHYLSKMDDKFIRTKGVCNA